MFKILIIDSFDFYVYVLCIILYTTADRIVNEIKQFNTTVYCTEGMRSSTKFDSYARLSNEAHHRLYNNSDKPTTLRRKYIVETIGTGPRAVEILPTAASFFCESSTHQNYII